MKYHDIEFDDYVKDEYGTWSQVCQSCVIKHDIDNNLLDKNIGHGLCGVKGCNNESDHYIDFKDMVY